MTQANSQGGFSCRGSRHAVPSRDQVGAERDADDRRSSRAAACRRRGARGGHRAFHFRHRAQQGGDRRPFRYRLRTRRHAAKARQAQRIQCPEGAAAGRRRRPASRASRRRLGLGHAVWCAREIVGDEPFAVLLPDMVTMAARAKSGRCLAQCIAAYEKHGGNIIAVEEVAPEETHQYGIVSVGQGFRPHPSRSPAWSKSRRREPRRRTSSFPAAMSSAPRYFPILARSRRARAAKSSSPTA